MNIAFEQTVLKNGMKELQSSSWQLQMRMLSQQIMF